LAERIVVAFVAQLERVQGAPPAPRARRFSAIEQRAEALGGSVCARGRGGVSFDFAPADLEEALLLAVGTVGPAGEDLASGDRPEWAVGLSQGELQMAEGGGSEAAWGPPVLRALALARIGQPGEVLVDPDMPAVHAGEITTAGARSGGDGQDRIYGLLLDSRQIVRRDAAEPIAALVDPDLVAYLGDIGDLLAVHAPLGIVRASPGSGGTRWLEEVQRALAPGRSLHLAPAGAEPLGSLRSAFAQAISLQSSTFAASLPSGLRRALDDLLGGDGADPRLLAELTVRWVTHHGLGGELPSVALPVGAVCVDDAMDVDDPSLEVVASAATLARGALWLLVRVDDDAEVPPPFVAIDAGPEIKIRPLERAAAEELARRFTGNRLSEEAARRAAERGGNLPLGILEALAEGSHAGLELAPCDWITRRLAVLVGRPRDVLTAAAVLGQRGRISVLEKLVSRATEAPLTIAEELVLLARLRWLRVEGDVYELPSRTHHETILAATSDAAREGWHMAASEIVEEEGGKLAAAEAARHAALAGDWPRGIRLALVAAEASGRVGLFAAEQALLAFADADDAESSGEIEESGPGPGQRSAAVRLESWIRCLPPSADADGGSARVRAIAALTRGATAEALKLLREGVAEAEAGPAVARSRAFLAYGIGLAAAGRTTEALLQGLQALARAREENLALGERACARFLSRLSGVAGHPEAALKWQEIADPHPSA
jgi:hypothetical protein